MFRLDTAARKRRRMPSGEVRVAKLRAVADPKISRELGEIKSSEEKQWIHEMQNDYPSNQDKDVRIEGTQNELPAESNATRKRKSVEKEQRSSKVVDVDVAKEEKEDGNREEDVQRATMHLNLLLKRVKEKASIEYSSIPDEVLSANKLELGIWSVLVSDQALIRCRKLHQEALDEFECKLREQEAKRSIDARDEALTSILDTSANILTKSKKPRGITSLVLPGSEKLSDKGLLAVTKFTENLEELNIARCDKVTDYAIRQISKQCGSSLQKLDLSECNRIRGPGLASIGEHCHNITHLSLRHFIHFQEWLLKRLVVGCKSLCHLDLGNCDKLTDSALKIIANRCRLLKVVNLNLCKQVSDVGILAITEYCHTLSELHMKRVELQYKITDVSLLGLAERCRALEVLDVTGCDSLTDVGLNWLASGCTSLTKILLGSCFKVTDVGMRAIAEGCKLLVELNISEVRTVTDVGIRHIASGCPLLEHLVVTNLFLLTDGHKRSFGQEGLQYMSGACPHIKSLGLDGCFRVSKQVLASFGKHRIPLQSLSMRGNPLLSSTALLKLLRGSGSTVLSLNLQRCPRVGDSSLRAIGKHCPKLRHLDVCHDSQVTNLGVHAVVQGCKELSTLELQGCGKLNDLAMLSVKEAGLSPGLFRLNLKDCENISETGVAWLTEMTSLRVLNLRGCQGVSVNGLKSVVGCWHHVHVRNDHRFFGIWPDDRCTEKRLIDEYGGLYKAARLIQSVYRQRVSRRELARLREEHLRHWVATKLQAVWRSRKARRYALVKRLQRDKEKEAAIRIQRQFRRKQALREVEARRARQLAEARERAAIVVQRCYRGKKARDVLRAARMARAKHARACEKAARMVQRVWRGREGRKKFELARAAREAQVAEETQAAVNIQSVFRGRKARKLARRQQAESELEALERENAARTIQRLVRGKLARKAVFGELLELEARRKAAVKIQSIFRSRKGRFMAYLRRQAALAEREEAAAVRIQCRWRTRKGQLSAHLLRMAQQEEAEKLQDSASKLQRLFRGKRGREHAKKLKNELAMKLRRQDDLESWAAIKVQTKVRQRIAVKRAGIQKEKRMRRWKELFDKEQNKPFYYNQDTGEIRWRRPQALLDLLPRPKCDNCGYYDAAMECSDCVEFFCDECFGQVHYGGKRKSHTFRALYDAYDKRIDYGDGDFPSLWPTEIQQDEMLGWQKIGTENDDAGEWERFWDHESQLYYYWNGATEVSTYDRPASFVTPREDPEVAAAWGKYWDEEHSLDFWYNSVTGTSTYDRPDSFVTPREGGDIPTNGASAETQDGKEAETSADADLDPLELSKLNDGWLKQYDDNTGKAFYHHMESGRSVYERPSGFQTPESKKAKKHPWIRAFDPELGAYVYSHLVTGESLTERPPGFITPRPETWKKFFDDQNGMEFYYNEEMKVSQYERPEEYESPRPEGYEQGNNGWVRYIYESQVLYENMYTREIVYERPDEFTAPEKYEETQYVEDTEAAGPEETWDDQEYSTSNDNNTEQLEEERAVDTAEQSSIPVEDDPTANGGWRQLYDTETESWYYQHRETGETQYERPEEFVNAPSDTPPRGAVEEKDNLENQDWSEAGCRAFFTDFLNNYPDLEMIQTQPLRPPDRETAQAVCDELGLIVQTKGVGKTRSLIVAKIDDEEDEE